MAKEATIQIRMTQEEKTQISKRAASMFMTLTEYMIHAGIAYTPSKQVQESIDRFNALVRQPSFTQEYINEATRPLAEKLEQDKAE